MLSLNESIDRLATANSAGWHGNLLRIEDGHVLRRALHFDIECQSKKGMLKKTWKKQVEEESVMVGLRREDELCRLMWIDGFNQIAIGLM